MSQGRAGCGATLPFHPRPLLLVSLLRVGTIYDLEGNPVMQADDVEAVFLNAIVDAAKEEPVYVVTNGAHAEFDERVRQLGVPVIVDDVVGDSALILAGQPSEWHGSENRRHPPRLPAP